jgi:outer membrane protein TolC
VKFAEAGYTGTVADYREAVLTAMREVQDSISGLGVLATARQSQADAVAAAQRAVDLATTRYQDGIANYLDVVTAQQALLSAERLLSQIQGEQLVTSVSLVKALGGGWDRASLDQIKIKSNGVKAPQR